MRVGVIGGAGGVGRRLTALLAEAGDEVTVLHRRADQAAVVEQAGGRSALFDLVEGSVEELAGLLRGQDAVVFSAGAHGTGRDQTTLIDGRGLEHAVDAARAAGVRRFVVVSVFPEAGRDVETNAGFEHYVRVKKAADVYLTGSDLDWVVVRPGTLTDAPGTGTVRAGWAVPYGDVPRDDVALFLAAVVREQRLHHVVVELTGGGTPVDEAVRALLP
ncbi:NAD(P)-binding oxidoreductase [Microlunatus flavus]|uniref:NAD(P)H-binding n=1 Tax=Microlunatus flavus TaxID=1036181 RepID=A0A1H9A2R3_9ACTN|nr:NAD(P)-binding oxidoreductase [Microlunatus flavus]SEP70905.1 NAD(P)H-binding [Microlunatus flavus]